MKKIEASSLTLLVGGENILISLQGKVMALWTIPTIKERYDEVMTELDLFAKEHPFVDFFMVTLKETRKPTIFANWYCVKDDTNEVTHRTFSRKEYSGLAESLKEKTVFKIN